MLVARPKNYVPVIQKLMTITPVYCVYLATEFKVKLISEMNKAVDNFEIITE